MPQNKNKTASYLSTNGVPVIEELDIQQIFDEKSKQLRKSNEKELEPQILHSENPQILRAKDYESPQQTKEQVKKTRSHPGHGYVEGWDLFR